jgi:hypothetical protein
MSVVAMAWSDRSFLESESECVKFEPQCAAENDVCSGPGLQTQ